MHEEKEERICLFIDLIEVSNSGTLENGIKRRLTKIQSNCEGICEGITYIAHSMCPRNKDSFETVFDGDLDLERFGWKHEKLFR